MLCGVPDLCNGGAGGWAGKVEAGRFSGPPNIIPGLGMKVWCLCLYASNVSSTILRNNSVPLGALGGGMHLRGLGVWGGFTRGCNSDYR